MTLDLPGRHASRVHGDDLLVEARKPPLIPGDQLRVERAFPIARNTQVQLGILGQHRLLRIAIAVIGLARRRLAIEMVVQFRVQDALGQRFLQLVEKPILGKHLLRIAPRQKLVQRALLDRHSPPPAASLWPHTQDSRQSPFIRYAADLAKVLDDGNNLRVIPMVTYGAVSNVTDLLNLRGIDVAITQADVLDHFRREVKIPDIENRIQYISPLFLAEVHIYAREEFKTLKDLAGKKVAFNTPGSAANLPGQVVFQRLGVQVEPVFINNAIALA